MIDVLFVGAGPVGLLTAIELKLRNPDCRILMLEKYKEYKRSHPLSIDPSSFINAHTDEDFQAFLHGLPKTIRTNELEDLLLAYARKLGIEIKYEPVTNCEELKQQYPDTPIFVGSDGSHSIVHKQVFAEEYQIKKTLQYIAEIKYEVDGSTDYLNKIMQAIPATTYAEHFISEFIGREKDGKTPVSVRMFIDEETNEYMKEATFKNPYNLSSEKIHPSVQQSIKAWLTAREIMAGEKRIEGSERITVTNLPVYASKKFVKEEDNHIWFLVGDAAFGMPYFRSLNNGILCSAPLAQTIDEILLLMVHTNEPVENYKIYVQDLVNKENFNAELKNMGVNSLEASASCSQKSMVSPIIRGKLTLFPSGQDYRRRMEGEDYQSSKCVLF